MAQAIKCVSLSDDIFRDHFPGSPVFPGALLIESMAQLAGVLVEETLIDRGTEGLLALLIMVDRARFRHPVRPGDSILIEAQAGSIDELKASVSATASVDDRVVAQAELAFVLGSEHPVQLYEQRRALVKLWREGSSW